MTRIILIASGKGGVGKTTVAANLAIALTKIGQDVLLVDADIKTGHLALHLGLKKHEGTLNDVLSGKLDIHNVIYYHPAGVKFVPTGATLKNIDERNQKNLAEVILELVGSVDIILIDAAAGIGGELKNAMSICDEILVVTNPDLPSIIEALKMHKYALKHKLKPLGILINRFSGKKYDLHSKNIEEFTEMPVVGIIPEDEEIKKAVMQNTSVILQNPEAKSAKEFKRIAARIVGKEHIYIEEGFIGKIKNLLSRL